MTILGQHTVSETRDLIAVLNGRTIDLTNGFQTIQQTPALSTQDPALAADWAAYLARWATSENNEQQYLNVLSIGNPTVPESVLPSEASYQRILKTVNPQLPNAYTDKDLMGLQIRIQKLTTIPWVNRQLPPDFDFDLSTYQAADSAAKGIQSAGSGALSTLGEAAAANWKPLVVGGIAVGAGLIIAKKVGML
jgi:hypothetical protein